MATASFLNDETDYTNKSNDKREPPSLESLRKRAFVPSVLPEDFLRIVLDEKQLNENEDRALAQHLQYNISSPPQANYMQYNQYRPAEADYGRGRFQINIVEAKLNKNYGFTKMDPYVRLRMANKIYETPTAYNGSKNPVWKKNIYWYIIFLKFLVVHFFNAYRKLGFIGPRLNSKLETI